MAPRRRSAAQPSHPPLHTCTRMHTHATNTNAPEAPAVVRHQDERVQRVAHKVVEGAAVAEAAVAAARGRGRGGGLLGGLVCMCRGKFLGGWGRLSQKLPWLLWGVSERNKGDEALSRRSTAPPLSRAVWPAAPAARAYQPALPHATASLLVSQPPPLPAPSRPLTPPHQSCPTTKMAQNMVPCRNQYSGHTALGERVQGGGASRAR